MYYKQSQSNGVCMCAYNKNLGAVYSGWLLSTCAHWENSSIHDIVYVKMQVVLKTRGCDVIV